MTLASTLYTYVALELHVLFKYVSDGSKIMIKMKATSIYPGVWVFRGLTTIRNDCISIKMADML